MIYSIPSPPIPRSRFKIDFAIHAQRLGLSQQRVSCIAPTDNRMKLRKVANKFFTTVRRLLDLLASTN